MTVRRQPASKISAVLSDIDGTLVTKEKIVTERSRSAVAALRQAGITFSIISSRPPRGIASLIKLLGITTPSGCFNGGLLVSPDLSVIQKNLLPPDVARRAVDVISSQGVAVWVFSGQNWYLHDPAGAYVNREIRTVGFPPIAVEEFGPAFEEVGKIVGVSADATLLERCEADARTSLGGEATVARSQLYYLDITSPQANKGAALLALSKLLAIPSAEIAVIGDGGNDVAMFQQGGLSIAMGNGSPGVKAAADFVTDSNSQDGFAKAIDRFIIGGDRTFSAERENSTTLMTQTEAAPRHNG